MLVPWPVGVALVSRATTSAESRMSGWEDGAANVVVIAVTATRMERRESIVSTIFVSCSCCAKVGRVVVICILGSNRCRFFRAEEL